MTSPVLIETVAEDLIDEIVELCLEARLESNLGAQLCSAEREQLTRQLRVFQAVPGAVLFAARYRGELVGFTFARILDEDLLRPSPSVFIEALYVSRSGRRQGVGRALMAHLAGVAASRDALDIYAQQLPGSRGTQRFLARLGFAPAGTHRVVSVTSLQRELARDVAGRRRSSSRALEDLIARRRRSRTATGSLDTREIGRQADSA